MNIPSRSGIKEKLQSIAQDAGFSGVAVDFVISVMSTGYYETILRSLGILRESSSETAVNVNSMISLACSRMYSVFRGKNARVTMVGEASEYQILKRGTKVYSGENFNLYVYRDVTLNPKGDQTIELIASKRYINESKKNKSDRYFVEFLGPNISEDIILYTQEDQTNLIDDNLVGRETEVTKNFRKHADKDIVFELTIPGWGVRYYKKSKNDINYQISAFEYLDNIDQELVNFKTEAEADKATNHDANLDISLDIENFIPKSMTIRNLEPRETLEEIKINYNTQIDSIYLIRSNSDLKDSFKLAFGSKIYEVDYEQFTEYDASKLPTNFLEKYIPKATEGQPKPPFVVFFYVPKKLPITSNELVSYINATKFYYMYDNIYACEGTPKNVTIQVTISTNDSLIAQEAINSLLAGYTNQFGITLKATEFITKIAKLDSINELIDFKLSSTSARDGIYDGSDVVCSKYEYLVINTEITIQ